MLWIIQNYRLGKGSSIGMFKVSSFAGGIHPLHAIGHGKSLSAAQPIEALPAPERVYIPMSQHIGAPCSPCVAVGDRVLRGQAVGKPTGFVAAPVHASVSGTVVEIAPHLVIGGSMTTCVVIENDFKDEWADACRAEPSNVDNIDAQAALSAVLEGGVVGMGGATFPAHVKLSPPKDKKIDFLLLNGAECEPYLTADHRMMLEESERIVGGIRILAKILGNPQCIVGIERNKKDAAFVMEQAVQGTGIRVALMPVKYPQGSEKQLVQVLAHRQVPSGKLPMDAGCVVVNVSSAAAVYDAVALHRPLTERVVTVTGAVGAPKNLRVRIGTPVQTLVDACAGLKENVGRVVSGGPMMGIALYDLSVPVTKGTSGVLALTQQQVNPGVITNCIRCGRCVKGCPIHLMPFELCNDVEKNDWAGAEKHNALDCIECGSCTYVCPAKRPITSSIRIAKRQIVAQRKKK